MNWHEYFTYKEETGDLIWKDRMVRSKGKNTTPFLWRGMVAGRRECRRGGVRHRIRIQVCGARTAAHRIIWEMHYGPIPEGLVIDHIDGDPWNNQLKNLRLATTTQNSYNQKRRRLSRSPLKGVTASYGGKFQAHIAIDGKNTHLGTFSTKGLAAVARAKAALKHHGKFARFS